MPTKVSMSTELDTERRYVVCMIITCTCTRTCVLKALTTLVRTHVVFMAGTAARLI